MKLLNNNIYKYVYITVVNIYIFLNKQSSEKSLKLLTYPRNKITGFTNILNTKYNPNHFLTPLKGREFACSNQIPSLIFN